MKTCSKCFWAFELGSHAISIYFSLSTIKTQKGILVFPFSLVAIKVSKSRKKLVTGIPLGRNLDPHFHEYSLGSSKGKQETVMRISKVTSE
jgi:hypothetical protein